MDEFEKCWDELITSYNLQENAWLRSLYVDRKHWVPAFLKESFWAGMSTTQQSESMNAFFDGYVHAKTNLKEFVDQFDNALKKKIENENAADFHSFSVTIPCISRSPIEKRFQELYTNAKFKEVQKQVTGMIDLNPKLLESDGALHIYRVEDEIRLEEFTKPVTHSVAFSTVDATAKCSCGLFEMRGILCRHIYAVFRSNEIKVFPDKYILDRWRKDIKRRYTLIHSSYDGGEQRADSNRYSELLNICYQMITRAAGTRAHTEDAKSKLYAMIELYDANQEPLSMTQTGFNACSTAKETNTGSGSGQVRSPHVVRGKGRLPSLRRASRMEIDMRKAKAKTKKAPSKGKRKERDGGDIPAVDTCRNLFGITQMDMPNVDVTGSQLRETVIQSQESMQFGLDGSAPSEVFAIYRNDMDGSQGRE
ncbi:protein FAR1-RELATED SEQUENCE 5-like [Carya illinoinensis]|uniref:protein FAR1-RELATED SEQUENCE 5-like n=1 Tax=Carya illinoinensis TaxID=32201 RepID=UPI001C721641|nr:protein FAR1-RELATED SEQUENCE 5-like [Carya illinoinensis]